MEVLRQKAIARILVFIMLFSALFAYGGMMAPQEVHADGDPILTVLVKDSVTGSPLTGYTAVLQHEVEVGWDYEWQDFETQECSGENGIVKFTKELEDSGAYRLVISKEGYTTYEADWDHEWYYDEWPTGMQEISLAPAGVTTKKVTVKAVDSSTGTEIEGAQIKLYNEALNPRVEVERNEDGAWYLEVNSDYYFYAYATAEGYEEGKSSGIFAMNTTPEDVTIELEKAVDPLEQAKAEAKADLANYRKNEDFADKEAVQEIRDTYTAKIDSAENADQVAAFLDEAKGLIDAQPLNPPQAYHTLVVKDNDTGDQLTGFTAELWIIKADSESLTTLFERAEDGKFYDNAFNTNTYYKLKVTKAGYQDYLSAALDGYGLKNGTVSLPAEVKLNKAQPVFTLTVKDKDTGDTVTGFTATVTEIKYSGSTEFESNNDGVFYKTWDKWNDYKLTVSAEGYTDTVLDFEYTGNDHVYPELVEMEKTPEAKLAEAKTKAAGQLQDYRASKADSDYDEDGIAELNNAVMAGNAAINSAISVDQVGTALKDAKAAIDAVKTKEQKQSEEAMNQAKAAANKVLTETAGIKNDDGKYTEESFKALTDAIAALEEELAKADATPESISQAVQKVKDALNNLQEAAAPEPSDNGQKVKKGKTYKVKGQSYKVTRVAGRASGTVTFVKAKNVKNVTVSATVKLADKKTYKVTQIGSKAFTSKKIRKVTVGKNVKKIVKNALSKSKAGTLVIKTKLLKKASVKGSLKGSKVKKVLVKVGSKKVNKKFIKKYKKFFTKKNAGRKVTVK